MIQVRLNPKDPPGRSNRKARAFEAEICRLRAAGYSCEAIREALVDVGVQVSISTVRREALRNPRRVQSVDKGLPATQISQAAPARNLFLTTDADPTRDPPSRTGKEIAESFFSGRINNPLIRARDIRENRGH